MIGAGTILNPILKILTTVAILAAISIFFVKPILDTAEKTTSAGREQSERIQREIAERADQNRLQVARTQAIAAVQSARAFGDGERARRILQCVRAAGKNPDRMDFCRTK